MNSRTAYVLAETLISVGINTALSLGFVVLVFHGQSQVSTTGPHGVVVDMAPQTFMVVLMSFLVPALLTRKRLAAGKLEWCTVSHSSRRFSPWLRALLVAMVATCVALALSWMLLPRLAPEGIPFRYLLIGKAAYGAALAACITPWSIHSALK